MKHNLINTHQIQYECNTCKFSSVVVALMTKWLEYCALNICCGLSSDSLLSLKDVFLRSHFSATCPRCDPC